MSREPATCAHPPKPAGSPQRLPPTPAAQGNRIEWLFRDALRRGHVHPLMELLRRYRGQDAA